MKKTFKGGNRNEKTKNIAKLWGIYVVGYWWLFGVSEELLEFTKRLKEHEKARKEGKADSYGFELSGSRITRNFKEIWRFFKD